MRIPQRLPLLVLLLLPLTALPQGEVLPEDAARVAGALHEMGCYEVSMGDTIGVGTPASGGRGRRSGARQAGAAAGSGTGCGRSSSFLLPTVASAT